MPVLFRNEPLDVTVNECAGIRYAAIRIEKQQMIRVGSSDTGHVCGKTDRLAGTPHTGRRLHENSIERKNSISGGSLSSGKLLVARITSNV